MRVDYICESCGKAGHRSYAQGKVPSHFFCSVACQNKWQKTRQDIVAKNKDPEFRKEYEALESEYTIIQATIDARKSKGLIQKELSIRSGIAQGDISKLENGNANPSIKTLQRLAIVMGKALRIEFL